jgi:predicted anti-sigma-YlaC factor YlaD
MSNVSECLTYPDMLCCLDGTPGRRRQDYFEEHLCSCVKCRATFKTIQEFIVDEATPEESVILDSLENSPLRSSPSATFRSVNLRGAAYEIVFIRM